MLIPSSDRRPHVTDAADAFLAGERPEDVAVFLADRVVDDPDPLLEYGERVGGEGSAEGSPGAVDGSDESTGVLLVLDGETGRDVFETATGVEAMAFAGSAMGTEGTIHPDLAGGTCPEAAEGEDHGVRYVLAFAEAENPDAGGQYAEGDVLHAYAKCACGTAYSDRRVLDG